ncbi:MAG: hypothetical protein WB952_17060 [Terriglobales bacterium]
MIVCAGLWFAALAHADATLLLEEPYGHFGAFTSTGHAAVYLSHICADTPVILRRCSEGESGVVISRYNKVAGYDWLAIPLIPYLYAVEGPDEIPLYANPKIVAFLRNRYRRDHLETIAPDLANGEPPEGNWTQLVGSAYDRTLYGFAIHTTAEQDNDFIREYNSRANRSRFNLLAHNCADFAKDVINFYYPNTLHRNLIADAGITTPKEIAKLLVNFSDRHPELRSSSFIVPQVPGSMPRSTAVHGVVESLLKSKKYVLPITAANPVATGVLAVAYLGGGRFDPKKHAMILESGQELAPPLPATERRAYENQLKVLLAKTAPAEDTRRIEKHWHDVEANGEPQLDEDGRPVLRLRVGEELVDVGIARDNILPTSAPPLAQELMAARLREELRRGGNPKASTTEVMSDWSLLQQLLPPSD